MPDDTPTPEVKPLAAARKRLDKPRYQALSKQGNAAQRKRSAWKRRRKSTGGAETQRPYDIGEVVGLRAAGVPVARIADVMGVTRPTVSAALTSVPGARDRIATLREALKGLKMERAHALEPKLWTRLEAEIDGGEAKDVDAITRALLASEKIQAAAAGEAHASGSADAAPSGQDLTILVQALLSAPGA